MNKAMCRQQLPLSEDVTLIGRIGQFKKKSEDTKGVV